MRRIFVIIFLLSSALAEDSVLDKLSTFAEALSGPEDDQTADQQPQIGEASFLKYKPGNEGGFEAIVNLVELIGEQGFRPKFPLYQVIKDRLKDLAGNPGIQKKVGNCLYVVTWVYVNENENTLVNFWHAILSPSRLSSLLNPIHMSGISDVDIHGIRQNCEQAKDSLKELLIPVVEQLNQLADPFMADRSRHILNETTDFLTHLPGFLRGFNRKDFLQAYKILTQVEQEALTHPDPEKFLKETFYHILTDVITNRKRTSYRLSFDIEQHIGREYRNLEDESRNDLFKTLCKTLESLDLWNDFFGKIKTGAIKSYRKLTDEQKLQLIDYALSVTPEKYGFRRKCDRI